MMIWRTELLIFSIAVRIRMVDMTVGIIAYVSRVHYIGIGGSSFEKTQPHIIHRDIKSSNVLLFYADVAKIDDFDLSNQAPDMAPRLHSTHVLGTFGYHAPEYAMTGQQLAQKAKFTTSVWSFWNS